MRVKRLITTAVAALVVLAALSCGAEPTPSNPVPPSPTATNFGYTTLDKTCGYIFRLRLPLAMYSGLCAHIWGSDSSGLFHEFGRPDTSYIPKRPKRSSRLSWVDRSSDTSSTSWSNKPCLRSRIWSMRSSIDSVQEYLMTLTLTVWPMR